MGEGTRIVHGQSDEVREIRRIARERLSGFLSSGDGGAHGINRPLLGALAESGLLTQMFPADLGGTGAADGIGAVALAQLREGVACESTEAETALALQGLGSYPILQSGSTEVIERWIPQVAGGQVVAAFALSEPEAGSDAAALECRAEPDGAGYRLTGVKRWISNAPSADLYTLFARTTQDAGARGVTAFLIPGDAEGLGGRARHLLSPHAIGDLELDGVYVPPEHVLGEVDRGFRVAMKTLDLFRPSVGAFAVGMGQAALEIAVDHADARQAFGQPIREFQAVGHALADMATKVHAARLLVFDAARAQDEGAPGVTRLAAMAKLFATEVAQEVVDAAVQIQGASGLEVGHPLEALYRDVRAPRIYEGTSEIQRTIIARQLYK